MNKDILEDIIYGLAVGDALGVPVEFYDRIVLQKKPVTDMRAFGTYNQPIGSWSDDTSLTLCLLDGLSFKTNSINFEKVSQNMIDWLNFSDFTANNYRFDVGNTCRKAIINMSKGTNPLIAGEVEGKGNGSLMRISPLILLTKEMNLEDKVNIIKDVCFMTHRNNLCFLACYFYISFAQNLLNIKDKTKAFDITIKEFSNKFSNEKEFEDFKRITSKCILNEKIAIYSSGYVIDTLEASIYCFLTTDNYKDCVLKAVNLGEDTDTIAAISGSLAGMFYGMEDIPTKWIDALLNKQFIDSLIEKSFN